MDLANLARSVDLIGALWGMVGERDAVIAQQAERIAQLEATLGALVKPYDDQPGPEAGSEPEPEPEEGAE